MRESFVIHTEYIDDLPEENKAEFLMYIYNYGSKGEEPELTGLAQTIWVKIKRRMDYDNSEWESTKAQRSEAGRRGGLKSAEARASKVKQSEANASEGKQAQANEAVTVSVNEFVTDTVTANSHTERACACENPQGLGKTQIDCYNLVTEHNKTARKDRLIPISSSFPTFLQKEMRNLYEHIGTKEPPERVTAALKNFIKVARSDTWRKSFTWGTFCKNYNDFTPEFFALERYLTSTPQTDDATKKPENVFFFAHKDDPAFHVETFQEHIDDWKAEGRPDGSDYFALQDKWEAEAC